MSRREVVRLSINLALSVAVALKRGANRDGITITEAVRRAVVLWKIVVDAQARGAQVVIVTADGSPPQQIA